MSKYREELLTHRKQLIESKLKQHELYDKSLMTISFGSLVVSVTFANNPLIINQPPDFSFLILAWVFWLASAILVLFSLISSQYAISKKIENVDESLNNPNQTEEESVNHWWYRVTEKANLIAGGLYVVGILFMLGFAIVNMGERTVNEHNDKKDSGDLKPEGQEPRVEERGFLPENPPPPPPPGGDTGGDSGGQDSGSGGGTSSEE